MRSNGGDKAREEILYLMTDLRLTQRRALNHYNHSVTLNPILLRALLAGSRQGELPVPERA